MRNPPVVWLLNRLKYGEYEGLVRTYNQASQLPVMSYWGGLANAILNQGTGLGTHPF